MAGRKNPQTKKSRNLLDRAGMLAIWTAAAVIAGGVVREYIVAHPSPAAPEQAIANRPQTPPAQPKNIAQIIAQSAAQTAAQEKPRAVIAPPAITPAAEQNCKPSKQQVKEIRHDNAQAAKADFKKWRDTAAAHADWTTFSPGININAIMRIYWSETGIGVDCDMPDSSYVSIGQLNFTNPEKLDHEVFKNAKYWLPLLNEAKDQFPELAAYDKITLDTLKNNPALARVHAIHTFIISSAIQIVDQSFLKMASDEKLAAKALDALEPAQKGKHQKAHKPQGPGTEYVKLSVSQKQALWALSHTLPAIKMAFLNPALANRELVDIFPQYEKYFRSNPSLFPDGGHITPRKALDAYAHLTRFAISYGDPNDVFTLTRPAIFLLEEPQAPKNMQSCNYPSHNIPSGPTLSRG